MRGAGGNLQGVLEVTHGAPGLTSTSVTGTWSPLPIELGLCLGSTGGFLVAAGDYDKLEAQAEQLQPSGTFGKHEEEEQLPPGVLAPHRSLAAGRC